MNSSYRFRSLWDVIKIEAENLTVLTHVLGQISASLRQLRPEAGAACFPPDMKRETLSRLQESMGVIERSGLAYAKGFLQLAISRVESNQPLHRVREAHEMLQEAIRIELGNTFVFSLSSIEAGYFQPTTPLFGAEVAQQFPSLDYEISEAGKCYAISRSTASVFHSVRCLEAGIRAISRCLGIPDPTKGADRNWSNMLRKVDAEVKQKWTSAGRMAGDGLVFDEAYATLAAIQNPYRNATMHLDSTYTAEDALHILEMVKGFMKKIASRMDENGEPKA